MSALVSFVIEASRLGRSLVIFLSVTMMKIFIPTRSLLGTSAVIVVMSMSMSMAMSPVLSVILLVPLLYPSFRIRLFQFPFHFSQLEWILHQLFKLSLLLLLDRQQRVIHDLAPDIRDTIGILLSNKPRLRAFLQLLILISPN